MQWAPAIPYIELGDILTGKTPYSRDMQDITVFDMTGLALQDLVVGEYLYKAAEVQRVGQRFPWPW